MKKSLIIAASCLALSCSATAGDLHVSGNLTELGNDTLVAFTYHDRQRDETVKVVGKDGAFDIHVTVDQPKYLVLQVRRPKTADAVPMRGYLMLTAMPDEEMKVTGSFSNYELGGSPYYQQLQECRKQVAFFEEGSWNIQKEFEEKLKQGADRDSLENALNVTFEELKAKASDVALAYIKQHPDQEACEYLLSYVADEHYKEGVGALSASVREGRLKSRIDDYAASAQKSLDREIAKKNVAEGKVAPDFTLKSIDGKDFSLSSLKGKTVVLDFWGSWCVWCIKGMPKMKEYYDKYKGKLEIVGIDCNDPEQKWRDAVKKHELPWLHVRNEGQPDVTVLYGISGFPTKFVIDPEGKISKVVVGESEDFYKYLDDTLGK